MCVEFRAVKTRNSILEFRATLQDLVNCELELGVAAPGPEVRLAGQLGGGRGAVGEHRLALLLLPPPG